MRCLQTSNPLNSIALDSGLTRLGILVLLRFVSVVGVVWLT